MKDKAKEDFRQERQEDDIDLVKAVRDLLISNGLIKEVEACFDNNVIILEAKDKIPEVQRFLLNRFWNLQLLYCSHVSTMEERFCLVPNGEVETWLKLFEQKIIPFSIEHRLPRSI